MRCIRVLRRANVCNPANNTEKQLLCVRRRQDSRQGRGLTMGKFIYEGGPKVEIEDRALTHLEIVMAAKLRRGEPFGFTWKEDLSVGGGRTTVWIHAGSSLVFKFVGSRQPAINRDWVDALASTANSPGGLYLVPEPDTRTTEALRLAVPT